MNLNSMRSVLQELVKTPFFRYFKTDLYCECPLWPDDGMCSLRDCSVCECEADEVPEPWKNGEESAAKEFAESCDGMLCDGKACILIMHTSSLSHTYTHGAMNVYCL